MALRVSTAPLPHKGRPGYMGADAFNISRGSGGGRGDPFAPSPELLSEGNKRKRAAKKDVAKLEEAWAWYAPLYVEEMRVSYRRHRPVWDALLAQATVTLCCYCGTAQRCHRRLLAEILVKLGADYLGEAEGPPK